MFVRSASNVLCVIISISSLGHADESTKQSNELNDLGQQSHSQAESFNVVNGLTNKSPSSRRVAFHHLRQQSTSVHSPIRQPINGFDQQQQSEQEAFNIPKESGTEDDYILQPITQQGLMETEEDPFYLMDDSSAGRNDLQVSNTKNKFLNVNDHGSVAEDYILNVKTPQSLFEQPLFGQHSLDTQTLTSSDRIESIIYPHASLNSQPLGNTGPIDVNPFLGKPTISQLQSLSKEYKSETAHDPSYYHSLMFSLFDLNSDGAIDFQEWIYVNRLFDNLNTRKFFQ